MNERDDERPVVDKPGIDKPKVLDTYVRAIDKLKKLGPEVDSLASEAASREGRLLGKVIALLVPLLPRLVEPIVLHEPWLEAAQRGQPKTLREKGVVVERTFSGSREGAGAKMQNTHRSVLLYVNEKGKLVQVDETARWTEPARSDVVWTVEASPVELTATFAREHLRGVLAGILDVLRERLARDLESKRELQERIERLEAAEKALG